MSIDDIAADILINHRRVDIKGCTCGWSELGKSQARHVVALLRQAGVLAPNTPKE